MRIDKKSTSVTWFVATVAVLASGIVQASVTTQEAKTAAFDEGRLRYAARHCGSRDPASRDFLESSQFFLQSVSRVSLVPLSTLEAEMVRGQQSAEQGRPLDEKRCDIARKEIAALLKTRQGNSAR